MVSASTIVYLTENWLSFAIFVILITLLTVNFFRKKTTGTLLLLIAYALYATARFTTALSYTLEFATTSENYYATVLGLLSILVAPFGILFLYIFGTRHLLKDSELVKIIHIIFVAIIIGIFGALIFTDFYLPYELGWLGGIQQISPELTNQSINIIMSLTIAAINIYIFVRLFVRAFILSRRTDKIIRKRGLQIIGWGLFLFFFGGLIGGIFYASQGAPEWLLLLLTVFRSLILISSYILMYIGWLMPNWFTRWIHGKSCFEQQYKQFIKIPIQQEG